MKNKIALVAMTIILSACGATTQQPKVKHVIWNPCKDEAPEIVKQANPGMEAKADCMFDERPIIVEPKTMPSPAQKATTRREVEADRKEAKTQTIAPTKQRSMPVFSGEDEFEKRKSMDKIVLEGEGE